MGKRSAKMAASMKVDRLRRLNARYPWMQSDMSKLEHALAKLLVEHPKLEFHIEIFKLFYGVGGAPHSLAEIAQLKGLTTHKIAAHRKEDVENHLQATWRWE